MIFFLISLLTYFAYLILKNRKSLLVLEQEKYDLKKYKKYIFTKQNIINPELLGLIVIVIAFFYDPKITGMSAVVLYTLLSLIEIRKADKKFKFSKKNRNIIITTLIIYLIIFIAIGIDFFITKSKFLTFDHTNIYYSLVIIVCYLSNFIIYISIIINNLITKKTKEKKNKKPKIKK